MGGGEDASIEQSFDSAAALKLAKFEAYTYREHVPLSRCIDPLSGANMNICTSAGFPEALGIVVNKAHALTLWFCSRSKAAEALKDAVQHATTITKKDMLPQRANDTRWLSSLHTFARIVDLKDAILSPVVLAYVKSLPRVATKTSTECLEAYQRIYLHAREWIMLEQLVALLRLMEIVTKAFQSAEPHISAVLPMVSTIVRLLHPRRDLQKDFRPGSTVWPEMALEPEIKHVRETFRRSVFYRFSKRTAMTPAFIVHRLASALDPSMRGREQTLQPAGLRGIMTNTATQRFIERLCQKLGSTRAPAPVGRVSTHTAVNMLDMIDGGFLVIPDSAGAQQHMQTSAFNMLAVEYARYTSEYAGIDRNVDAMRWWLSRAAVYPTLSEVALYVLGIPCASVVVERLFSHCGLIYTPRRQRMKDDLFKARITLRLHTLSNDYIAQRTSLIRQSVTGDDLIMKGNAILRVVNKKHQVRLLRRRASKGGAGKGVGASDDEVDEESAGAGVATKRRRRELS